MSLSRHDRSRRRALRRAVDEHFDTYEDASKVVGYSRDWLKSRLRPNATHRITDNAYDAIRLRLAERGIVLHDLGHK